MLFVNGLELNECNVTHSCWTHPPLCQQKTPNDCVSVVKWKPKGEEGYEFEISSYINTLDPSKSYWIAVGISHNQRMDDDTVFECISSPDGHHRAQISFNDETHNQVLHQATSQLLHSNEISLIDGFFKCNVTYLPDNRLKVLQEDQFKIHQIESKPFYLLFAKGSADRYTFEKDIHFMNDGPDFPWITGEMVGFCRNCTDKSFAIIGENSIQTKVQRYWRYRIAVFHGSILIFCWWVLVSNAILIARFFKPLWPKRKLCGVAVWFQLHRLLNLVAFPLEILSVLLIFFQSGWALSKKMHAITGVTATVMALLNPLVALIRPAPDSDSRPIFNWIHWFFGMFAWIFASVTILLSVPLGKTGLYSNYGPTPFYIMAGYILFFIAINILLEMITSTSDRRVIRDDSDGVHRFIVSQSGMSLSVLNGPTTEHPSTRVTVCF
ncbi:unnamed protein product, partial [Mesorhabditis belari]|uniref:ascorbate ferrireductase (transmembrane) n=1 Tax=Mesorhabditis belari TaxID=2138241 RepID=A0AAF3F1C6_9BILA